MEFLRSFLRRHFEGKPSVASRNFGCFLTLGFLLNISLGTSIWLSQEFTVYANQRLTLSCKPRDSPSNLVHWYKTNRSNDDHEDYILKGTSYTITKATEDDAGMYVCSGEEYGFYDIKKYIMVNVVGRLLITNIIYYHYYRCFPFFF